MTINGPSSSPRPGPPRPAGIDHLHELNSVPLSPAAEAEAEKFQQQSLGPPAWRQKKRKEFRDVLALLTVAPYRLKLLHWHSAEELRLVLAMNVTVPCMRPGGELVVESGALLELRYPQEAMTLSLPGTAFVRVAQPGPVWLGTADPATGVLCLGRWIPRGHPVPELLWLTYVSLSGQAANFDIQDWAGILNAEATHFWAAHQDRLPLMNESFLHETEQRGAA